MEVLEVLEATRATNGVGITDEVHCLASAKRGRVWRMPPGYIELTLLVIFAMNL